MTMSMRYLIGHRHKVVKVPTLIYRTFAGTMLRTLIQQLHNNITNRELNILHTYTWEDV